ncbi:hypothetical protein [Streptomyces sp. NPDC050560]|uniref:hypothetical protein n=1 Tax=Streptomyces sp. NPDC050560 TaxID=3365630 RepID=UPI0037936665
MVRGRRSTFAAAVAGLALAVPLMTGCGAVDRALDCLSTADSIADSVTDLQQAVEGADDSAHARDAIDAIGDKLDKIGDRTDDTDVNKAVDHLGDAVDSVRDAIDDGDKTPDLTPVTDAAGELTKVCTP